jgi:biopolymer transport protein ExbD
MAFSGMSSNGARGRGRWRSVSSMSEMNVVPLVDVVLVLLIIFMVTASAMEIGLEIQLPQVKTTKQKLVDEPAVIHITEKGDVYLKGTQMNIRQLGERVKQLYPNAKDVYVRADKDGTVGTFVQVMAELREAGLGVKTAAKAENVGKQ